MKVAARLGDATLPEPEDRDVGGVGAGVALVVDASPAVIGYLGASLGGGGGRTRTDS